MMLSEKFRTMFFSGRCVDLFLFIHKTILLLPYVITYWQNWAAWKRWQQVFGHYCVFSPRQSKYFAITTYSLLSSKYSVLIIFNQCVPGYYWIIARKVGCYRIDINWIHSQVLGMRVLCFTNDGTVSLENPTQLLTKLSRPTFLDSIKIIDQLWNC